MILLMIKIDVAVFEKSYCYSLDMLYPDTLKTNNKGGYDKQHSYPAFS